MRTHHQGAVTVKLTQTLEASDAYGDALDAYLDSAADTFEVNAADWAYVRWGTAVSLVRHQASAALSAVVTRGLVEEAIRWDWSAATGRVAEHNQASAARELHGLRMKRIDFEWLIPPGGRIELRQPFRWLEDRELSSHARIMGSQLDPVAIDQLSAAAFRQLKTVLDGYAHSSPLAGFAFFESGGYEPSDELAAPSLQLAAASATVIGLTAVQGSATLKDALLAQTQAVSAAATVVHGIRVSPTQSAGTPPSLRLGTEYPPVVRASKLAEPTGPTDFHHWAIGELLTRLKDMAVELTVHRRHLPLEIRGLRAVAEGHLGSVAACIEVASASLNDQSVGELIPLVLASHWRPVLAGAGSSTSSGEGMSTASAPTYTRHPGASAVSTRTPVRFASMSRGWIVSSVKQLGSGIGTRTRPTRCSRQARTSWGPTGRGTDLQKLPCSLRGPTPCCRSSFTEPHLDGGRSSGHPDFGGRRSQSQSSP